MAKKSKEETSGGEGVEVVKNEPYEDENSKGQYTEKIYHLGRLILSLFQSSTMSSSSLVHARMST